MIGISFYLVAASTIGLMGDSLFKDTIRQQMSSVSQLAVTLGEHIGRETADAFYQRLEQAARQSGGRLLVVDMDGKVIYDTFNERCGTLLSLGEVHSVLRGETDGDYGFHLQDGAGVEQASSLFDRFTGRDVSRIWVGCFTAARWSKKGRSRAFFCRFQACRIRWIPWSSCGTGCWACSLSPLSPCWRWRG